jgi:hypothetical protein
MSKHYERAVKQAQKKNLFKGMVSFLSNAETKDELEKAAVLFVLDTQYPRADICLALKTIKLEKGWR